ncbi:Hypothetical predicted protein [Olea europaea subsp. europaea]|uniref:Uncharacterized protein n=1 Tax=Olea europaea subsp. europaea TaxID=158383 RepID=A0A8S0QAB9_OLEEU|nr:Hypothetical predicted protein [Olea europaea subsp. europaea]
MVFVLSRFVVVVSVVAFCGGVGDWVSNSIAMCLYGGDFGCGGDDDCVVVDLTARVYRHYSTSIGCAVVRVVTAVVAVVVYVVAFCGGGVGDWMGNNIAMCLYGGDFGCGGDDDCVVVDLTARVVCVVAVAAWWIRW